jgi:Ca-activated chloride channel family protein
MRNFPILFSPLLALFLVGCGDDAGGLPASFEGSTAVSQGGPQDIGAFRATLDAGQVPAPSLLEPVGFFAEHAVDLPPADCGHSVCPTASMIVAPRFDGSNFTMAYIALNSAVDPASLADRPTHTVLVVEQSIRTDLPGDALASFLDELGSEDRVTLLQVDDSVRELAAAVSPAEVPELSSLARGRTFDLLAALVEAAERVALDGYAERIVLLTSGVVDAGITEEAPLLAAAEAIAADGVAIRVIGHGQPFEADLLRRLAEASGGSMGFAEDRDALAELLRLEGRTGHAPLATNMRLTVTPGAGYRVGRVIGARSAGVENGNAVLESAVLMLGIRTGSSDVDEGRRGGGGGLFVELLPTPGAALEPPNGESFRLRLAYDDALAGERVAIEEGVTNSLAPGRNPDENWPVFLGDGLEKPFMMVNMFIALEVATTAFYEGSCAEARGMIPMMAPMIDEWQLRFDDPDLDADWALMLQLDEVIAGQCDQEPREPRTVALGCFGI